jgi:hypothetical protein
MIKKLKWLSVFITVIAAITISFRLTDITTSYIIFFIGHIIMVFIMLKTKDWSLLTMNIMWILLDIVGFINWCQ